MSGNLLQEFLAEQALLPGKWGQRDCCLLAADWIASRIGSDPAADLRGAYEDYFGAYKIIKRNGGFLVMVEGFAKRLNLDETDDPLTGDVGVVNAPIERVGIPEVLAIRAGKLWCSRALHGLVAGEFHCIKAWRIP